MTTIVSSKKRHGSRAASLESLVQRSVIVIAFGYPSTQYPEATFFHASPFVKLGFCFPTFLSASKP